MFSKQLFKTIVNLTIMLVQVTCRQNILSRSGSPLLVQNSKFCSINQLGVLQLLPPPDGLLVHH